MDGGVGSAAEQTLPGSAGPSLPLLSPPRPRRALVGTEMERAGALLRRGPVMAGLATVAFLVALHLVGRAARSSSHVPHYVVVQTFESDAEASARKTREEAKVLEVAPKALPDLPVRHDDATVGANVQPTLVQRLPPRAAPQGELAAAPVVAVTPSRPDPAPEPSAVTRTTTPPAAATARPQHLQPDGTPRVPTVEGLGCFSMSAQTRDRELNVGNSDTNTPTECAARCVAEGLQVAMVMSKIQCWCLQQPPAPSLQVAATECSKPCSGNAAETCGSQWHANVFRITSFVPEVITFFVEPAKNRGSLFLTGRLAQYGTGRYVFRSRLMNAKITRSAAAFRQEMCVATPGLKFFVGHGELVLANWPGNCVFMVTGDEAGDWGLTRNGKYYGLHGPGAPFSSNESHPLQHILLPAYAKPWFRQYYHTQQVATFGHDVVHLPLGSRTEFQPPDPANILPASKRGLVYSYMVAITDPSRQRLADILKNDTLISPSSRFLHVSQDWHPNAGHADYVGPEEYARKMANSVFIPCPKGHSVEQFRLYEAMESGAIPVLENRDNYLADHLPPEYLDSPMLRVADWSEAPAAMQAAMQDPVALDARQARLREWYTTYMRGRVAIIEATLEKKRLEGPGFGCADLQKSD